MKFIEYLFKTQRFYLVNWIPFLQGIGIAIYFSLSQEPSTISIVLLSIIGISLIIHIILTKRLSIFCIIIFTILLGFISSKLRTNLLNTPILQHKLYAHNIRGKISKIEHTFSHTKLLLCNIKNISCKVRCLKITVRNQLDNSFEIGDKISLSALLYPSSKAASEFSYDFARTAYFHNITGNGFAISNITLLQKRTSASFLEHIEILRLKIYNNIVTHITQPKANILSALLIGKKEGIQEDIMKQIRFSGLAHLFAISGLHLSFIAGLFISTVRYLLATSEKLTIQYNIKKLSAVICMPIIFIYLLLTGYAISAQRAFIMVILGIIAIMLDKRKNNFRFLAISASIILLFEPEYLFTPSFQMSFAAVLSLISSYNLTNKIVSNISNSILKFFLSTILSSIIATIGTLPYVSYHFNYFSTGGILANLIAIPLTTFIIIPLGIVYILLIPLHLEQLLSRIIEINIELLLNIAKIASQNNNLVIYIHSLPNNSIIFITIGLLILCLWQGKTKLAAFIPILAGIVLAMLYQTPDLIINDKNRAIKENDNQLYTFGPGKRNFILNTWKNQNGQQDISSYKNYKNANKRFICPNEKDCIYKKFNHSILITKDASSIANYCKIVDLIIQVSDSLYKQCDKPHITYKQLTKYGSHSIKITKNKILVYYNHSRRPWSH